jgi:amidase
MPEMSDDIHGDEYTILATEIREDMARYLKDRLGENELNSLEAIVEFNRANAEHELQHFGQDIFEFALTMEGRASDAYKNARKRSSEWAENECLGPALNSFDLLIAPAYGPAWKSDLTQCVKVSGGAVTSPSALLGWPLLSVPMGLVDGLPVAMAIVGRAQDEARMLALGEIVMNTLGTRAVDGFKPEFRRPQRG